MVEAKYTGLHALRHFYASWCRYNRVDLKVLQTLMGHSSFEVTANTYSHIFPEETDNYDKLARAERTLLK
jgi:integrase